MPTQSVVTAEFAPREYPFLSRRGPDELGWFTERYRVVRELGRGGMGVVFLAEDQTLGRPVALKLLLPQWADRPGLRVRFLDEARAMARHRHERIVPVYDTGEAGGLPYLTMPHLQGETLQQRLTQVKSLPSAESARIAIETAEGLAVAHAAGHVHRDIKPGNLWLTADGDHVILLDFGLARPIERPDSDVHTPAGAVVGTPQYMSPEQARGDPLDGRSDLFSLGVLLYEMLTGRRPFDGDSHLTILQRIASLHPKAPRELCPDVPSDLSDLTMRLLAKDRNQRPGSSVEVITGLNAGEAMADRTTLPVLPNRAPASGWSGKVGWLAGLTALLVVGMVYALWPLAPNPSSTPPVVPSPPGVLSQDRGFVDVLLAEKAGQAVRLYLGDFNALPVQTGDRFRIEAEADRELYLYLFWVTCEGQALPVFPWTAGKWGTRPMNESPRKRLELPATTSKGYQFSGSTTGMETLILLGREQPLEVSDAEVQTWFAGLTPQRALTDTRSAVWFVDGRVIGDGPRKRSHFEEVEANNPTLQMQSLLQERLAPHATFTAAVSFAKQGR